MLSVDFRNSVSRPRQLYGTINQTHKTNMTISKRKPRIAIIGTGRMGKALGKSFLQVGYFVAFGSRQPETKNIFHEEVGTDSRIYGVQAAIDAGEIIIIALPHQEVANTVRKFAASLRNKVVIDITNPFDAQPNDGSSSAQVTESIIGKGATVVAAFKTNFENTFENVNDSTGKPREVLFASNDEKAKTIIKELIYSIGFKPIDCGTLAQAVVLDHMVPLLIRLDAKELDGKHQLTFKLIND